MFDTSCATDSDCIEVTLGDLCTADCLCGGASINAADQAEYQQLIAALPTTGSECECPFLGSPTCVAGQCTVCGPASHQPGCPDAGQ
jgi:hypothetical protein